MAPTETDSVRWSLRRRLQTILGFAVLATVISGAVAMYWAAEKEDDQLHDVQLADMARTILAFSEHELGEILEEGRATTMHAETAATLGQRFNYQIWTRHGTLMLHSFHAPKTPFADRRQMGYADVDGSGGAFRVFTMASTTGDMVIQMAERVDLRSSAFGTVGRYFALGMLPPFTLILFVTWWLCRRALRSLESTAAQLARRSPFDLTPIEVDDPPRELQPMLCSINTLMARTSLALSTERGFTSLAAHELRTPLAGLRAQAQVAIGTPPGKEQDDALAEVTHSVDRASHLLDQLLDLARAEGAREKSGLRRTDVEVASVYDFVAEEFRSQRAQRKITVDAHFEAPRVHAEEVGLALLLRNIVGNAIRYTPVGGKVSVSTETTSDGVTLTVDDSGPGIPPQQRAAVFTRFERLGRNDSFGVGLGMSIVQSVVEAHSAVIRLLDSPLGGLRVQISFPPVRG